MKDGSKKNHEKQLLIALGVIAVIAAVILFGGNGKKSSSGGFGVAESSLEIQEEVVPINRISGGSASRGGGGSSRDKSKISMADFAIHNTAEDCWVAFDGLVYDITDLLPVYPGGGSRIEKYCGTLAFQAAFMRDDVMTPGKFKEQAKKTGGKI